MSWGTNCGQTRSPIFKQLDYKPIIPCFGVRIRLAVFACERPAKRRSTLFGWDYNTKMDPKTWCEGHGQGFEPARLDLEQTVFFRLGPGNCATYGALFGHHFGSHSLIRSSARVEESEGWCRACANTQCASIIRAYCGLARESLLYPAI